MFYIVYIYVYIYVYVYILYINIYLTNATMKRCYVSDNYY